MKTLTLPKPDDCHLHLRDGKALATTVKHAAKQFARAIIMPNLTSPVTTVEAALAYRQRILSHLPPASNFAPMMALYLTEDTPLKEIDAASDSPFIVGCKLYPAGATTHSDAGVKTLERIYPVLARMEARDLPLLVHAESTEKTVDTFDREAYFIEHDLLPIVQRFPKLRLVVEHISTQEAVDFVLAQPAHVAATITAHHLLLNRNDLFVGGIRPHHYCLPIVKRKRHQEAIIHAAISGNSKFFLGTDSAPHAQKNKQTACGCAGIYTAHAAMEFYAEIFEQHKALDKLPAFASQHGAKFYGWAPTDTTITLTKHAWRVPASFALDKERLIPLRANEMIAWQLNAPEAQTPPSQIKKQKKNTMKRRFRGFLPVVVDVETGGFNHETDALLEMAIVLLNMDEDGYLHRGETHAHHIKPFPGANLNPASLEVNRIDPYHPFRLAIPESEALTTLFTTIKHALKEQNCQRAVLIGHNSTFDLSFVKAAVQRCGYKNMPFHAFTTFDTAALAGLAYGETVLARALEKAGFSFDQHEAHSAIYDAEKTADLFCDIVNRWQDLGGWPLSTSG